MYPLPTGFKAWIDDVVVDDARSRPGCRRGAQPGRPRRGPAIAAPRRSTSRRGPSARPPTGCTCASGSSPATRTSTATRSDARAGGLRPATPHPAGPAERQSRGRRSSAAWRTCQSRSSRARRRAASTSLGAGMGGVEERRQGEHGPTADRRSVRGRREDRVEAAVVADRTEGGDARLAHERIGGCCRRQLDRAGATTSVADALDARHMPRRRLRRRSRQDRPERRAGRRRDGGRRASQPGGGRPARRPPAPRPRRRRWPPRAVRGRRGRQRARRHRRSGARPEPPPCHPGARPGRRCAASVRSVPQSFSRFVIVVTITAMAKALTVAMTAPTRRTRPPLVNRDTSRCTGFGEW